MQITAMGVYACFLDGKRVGDFVLAPGWTNFKSHIQYQTYDVTDMLSEIFCMEIKCGNGWAVSAMGDTGKSVYTDHISCIFCLEITYENGMVERFVSDEETEVYTSEIVYTEIYHGETVDRTQTSKFVGYAVVEKLDVKLLPQMGEVIREQEWVEPVYIFTTPRGETVLDFGQNMTGYVGTPHLLHALSQNGYVKTAYDLLLRENYPSWLYAVNKGATTVWEHWDGIKEDGGFWSADMNSFNHYAYGAVFDWMFENIGGIRQRESSAGYTDVLFSPVPDIRLGFADVAIETRRGLLRSAWRYEQDCIQFEFAVPQGTMASAVLPDGTTYVLQSGNHIFYTKQI